MLQHQKTQALPHVHRGSLYWKTKALNITESLQRGATYWKLKTRLWDKGKHVTELSGEQKTEAGRP